MVGLDLGPLPSIDMIPNRLGMQLLLPFHLPDCLARSCFLLILWFTQAPCPSCRPHLPTRPVSILLSLKPGWIEQEVTFSICLCGFSPVEILLGQLDLLANKSASVTSLVLEAKNTPYLKRELAATHILRHEWALSLTVMTALPFQLVQFG